MAASKADLIKEIESLKAKPAEVLTKSVELIVPPVKEIDYSLEERLADYPTTIPALVPVVAYAIQMLWGIVIPTEVILAITGSVWGLLRKSK